ncbi:uncharacterized protein RHOBADRAFT_17342 [Rhodotorula graminis WP1]|uniref:Ubiquitin-like protease family profile domain-containing protein n=1 Tax=Rhodotorula graminis (strain WP1) TaxID=578459 RepID=A0A0P9GJA3_RHOGW|nr:uncharacterized protein RHOBADRAFT_17342 [Rhodotorula graminis WP1]KPV73074.1 hypothetical protein RHOBADRAFT_17342 [Rhodotorula graminis WP1]
MFAASGKKAPRAAQASNDKGKTKAEIDNALFDQVKAVKLKAFFVGRKAVPPDYAHTDYTLLYNTRGKPKVTLRRKAPDAEPEDVVLEYPMGEPGAVSVTWGDTKRLRDEEFLNDTLIEFGLKCRDRGVPDAAKLAPQIHVFNSFFYKQLSSKKDLKRGMDPYLLVEKWTKRVDLFSKRYIVVPINE